MGTEFVWLTEADVAQSADLAAAIAQVESVLFLEHHERARTMNKTSVSWGAGETLHAIGGVIEDVGVVGAKTWAHAGGSATPLLVLWDAASGDLMAVIEAFALGQLRTAAVVGVATDHLAASSADVMAVIGSGAQAAGQVAAVAAVRPLAEVRVHSPTAAHRSKFVAALRSRLATRKVVDCASVEEAVSGAGVVTTVSRSREPFLDTSMIASDIHINAVGAISPERRELTDDVVSTATCVVADSVEAALQWSSELEMASSVVSLAALVAGHTRPAGLSVFKSMGLGLADVAIGAHVLHVARETGAGRVIPSPDRVAPRLFGSPLRKVQP